MRRQRTASESNEDSAETVNTRRRSESDSEQTNEKSDEEMIRR